jgi:hypothetical protein
VAKAIIFSSADASFVAADVDAALPSPPLIVDSIIEGVRAI